MGLDWLKLLTSDRGWVSENYLGFCRVSKWYYSTVPLMDEDEYVEPNVSVDKWTVKMCQDWLKVHDYRIVGKVGELRKRIQSIKSDTVSESINRKKSICSVLNFIEMIGSMVSMVAAIMTPVVTTDIINNVDREVKIFLSNLDKVHKTLPSISSLPTTGENIKPIWLTKYNFQSLLNIPETMNFMGPLVNLWEGSNQGEGYLRYAKPKISNIHKKIGN